MRYFRVKNKEGWYSIWETDDKKKKERVIFASDKEPIDLEKMRKQWTNYTGPGTGETEKEITEAEAFAELL